MFLNTTDRIINLKNVSNINIIKNRNRIVFNMNYTIELHSQNNSNTPKYISDYVYWDAPDSKTLNENIKAIEQEEYYKRNFFTATDNYCFININEISSIKYIKDKLRIVINLSHPVTFKDKHGNNKFTSEFIYVDCKTEIIFNDYIKYIKYLSEI